MIKYIKEIFFGLAALLITGCQLTSYENPYLGVNYDSDHIKMAIKSTYKSIAVLPFFNNQKFIHGAKYARRSFYANLASMKHYDLVPLDEIDGILKKLPRKILDPKNCKKLAKYIKADLFCYGWVEEQEHSYGLVYASTTVRVKINIVDAKTGKVVWKANDERSRTVGGIDPYALYKTHSEDYYWARNILNRYDELFRDMMLALPDRSVSRTLKDRIKEKLSN